MERIRQFLNKNIYIFSVRQGLLLTIPFLILGSFSMVIMQFPLKAWQELLPGFAGGSVKLLLMAVYQATRQWPCAHSLHLPIHQAGCPYGGRSGALRPYALPSSAASS